MAKLVLAAGVPHPPRLVYEMTESPGKMRGEALMKQVRRCVDEAEPDHDLGAGPSARLFAVV